ncbi:nucleotide exchange factor GrpE [Nocardia higoensis]|uniref:Nucleotide exchange factor GrpE n=1 Tax=Nocardia higoensis TaxID=228599 RepID=A0ABS0DAH3_9NOCA|nr:nucleotide exchange factor GrpE [Nocardia higoensis]MBF6354632.1 nucleotide exchange factor GrpE [Nocardia higoensis]
MRGAPRDSTRCQGEIVITEQRDAQTTSAAATESASALRAPALADSATSSDPAATAGDPPATPVSSSGDTPTAPSAVAPASRAGAESADAAKGSAALIERIDDLTRIVARQAAMIERLADEAKARDRRDRAGADLPLVVDLFALYGDTVACAETAASDDDRAAFTALAVRLERLLTGRGATLVTPVPDSVFDSRTMEATDVVDTDDPDADRTVAALLAPGLQAGDRSVRPASVVVRRHRPVPGR